MTTPGKPAKTSTATPTLALSEFSSFTRRTIYIDRPRHCVGEDGDEAGAPICDAPKRDYNIGLRVGLLFVILATSAFGVFGPLFLQRAMGRQVTLVFTFLKQFGTGIVISTAFIHVRRFSFSIICSLLII